MTDRFERHIPYCLLLAFLINFVILAFLSEGSIGGADDIAHFKFTRYAFRYPEFFLDPWAKPLFTMLMAPFAQLGMIGVRIFNILLGLAAALLTYHTAKRLAFRHSWLAIFLLVFTPLYSALMISGMTEILFSFILILGIYLYFLKRSTWSAAVISLLPFVRTEGIVIFPLFILAYAFNRQWKAIPFLAAGFLFFSIIGSFHYHDFFWVVNSMPYTGSARDIYGTGELFYYIHRFRPIFGLPLFFLIIAGLIYVPIQCLSGWKDTPLRCFNIGLVGFLPFVIYLAAHSYVWWKGTGNAVGEIRVMAAVFPPAVLLALFGWNGLLRWLPLHGTINISLSAILAVMLVFSTHRVQQLPVEYGPTQSLLKETAKWFKTSHYAGSKTIYFDPYWWFFLEIDPTRQEKSIQFMPDTEHPQHHVLPGEIVVWDAHYGPNEGRLPLNRLMGNPCFELIKVFRPDIPFQVLGGYDYQICFFKRTECDRQALLTSSSSCQVNEDLEFVKGIYIPVGDLNIRDGSKVKASFYHQFHSDPEGEQPLLVISLEDAAQIYSYQAWEIRPEKLNEWELSQYEHVIPEWNTADDIFKVYIWNRGRCRFNIKDFTISLEGPG